MRESDGNRTTTGAWQADELDELTARVTELELKHMEQAALVDTLESLLREQDARIAELERTLLALTRIDPDDLQPR